MKEDASQKIAGFICDVLDDESTVDAVAKKTRDLCTEYPLYTGKSHG
jgi:glycine/serine hydroxymethyltransferase